MPSVTRPERIAYVMSWFPAVSETFILDEMLALEEQGLELEIYPLFGARTKILHPGADALVRRARCFGKLSLALVMAQLYWLVRRPRRYLRAWSEAITGNLDSPRFLARSLVVVPVAAAIARDVERRRIDHLHAHWATHPALAALVVHTLTGLPYSFTTHAHDLYVDRTMLARKVGAARFVVTVSEFNRRLIEKELGPEAAAKTFVVRCGVDVESFVARPPRIRDTREPLKIACVAAFRKYKGHPVLIDACAALLGRGVRFELQLVGDGPERGRVEELVRQRGLSRHVRFLGACARPEVLSLLRAADVGVLPSIVAADGQMEGVPVFLMECLAFGLPAISTRISGIPELVRAEETGLLVEPGNPWALAAGIERLASSPALAARLAHAGRTLVEDRHSIRRNASALARLFRTGRLEAVELPPLSTAA